MNRLVLLALIFLSMRCGTGENGARVLRIIDGDTFTVEVPGGEETIRVLGIDCPETGEHGAAEATAYVRGLLEGRRVRLERHGRDVYGRTLAAVTLEDGRDLAGVLLENGHARKYRAGGRARKHYRLTLYRRGDVWWVAAREPGGGRLRRMSLGTKDETKARRLHGDLERRWNEGENIFGENLAIVNK